jgi:hypothetical protein
MAGAWYGSCLLALRAAEKRQRWNYCGAAALKGAEEAEDGQDFFKQRVKGLLGDRAGIPDAEAARINGILRQTELPYRSDDRRWRIRPEYLELTNRGKIVFHSHALA